MRINRQGIVVWFQHMKNLRQLRRYGHLVYTSKKHRYGIIYVNQDDLEHVMEQLDRLHFVSKIEPSYKPHIRTDYENAKPDKAKEYDYKYGL